MFYNLDTQTTTTFDNIDVITGSGTGIYSVDQAFHAVDLEITNIKSIIGGEESQASSGYKRLRYKEVGFFDNDGTAQIVLPKTQYGAPSFPLSSMEYVNLSVMVKDGDAWTNDLLSVNIVSGGIDNDEIHVLLDAPALSNTDQYRLLAINENPDDYLV